MKWRASQIIASSDRKPARGSSLAVVDETIVFLAQQFGRKITPELTRKITHKKAAQ
jgi:hypothetical protein